MKVANFTFLVVNPWVRLFFTIPVFAAALVLVICRMPLIGVVIFTAPFWGAMLDIACGRQVAQWIERRFPTKPQ